MYKSFHQIGTVNNPHSINTQVLIICRPQTEMSILIRADWLVLSKQTNKYNRDNMGKGFLNLMVVENAVLLQ